MIYSTVECPDGYITRYDTCYYLQTGVNDTMTYQDASDFCQNKLELYGGHLLFVNDNSEEVFVSDMLLDADSYAGYFIGNMWEASSSDVVFDWSFWIETANLSSWDSIGMLDFIFSRLFTQWLAQILVVLLYSNHFVCKIHAMNFNPAKKETPHSFKGQQLENKSLYRFVIYIGH